MRVWISISIRIWVGVIEIFIWAGSGDFVAFIEPLGGDREAHILKEQLVALGHLVVFLGAVEFDVEERQDFCVSPVQFDNPGDELVVDEIDDVGGVVLVEVEFDLPVNIAERIGGGVFAFDGGQGLPEEEEVAGTVCKECEALVWLVGASDAGEIALNDFEFGAFGEGAPCGGAHIFKHGGDGVYLVL